MPFFSQAVAASKSIEVTSIVTDQLAFMVDPVNTGNMNDLVGSVNGTLTNGAYLDANNYLITDGVNDYVDFGVQSGTSSVGLSGLDNWTIVIWYQIISGTNLSRIMGKGDSAGTGGWAYAIETGDDTWFGTRLWTNNDTNASPAQYNVGWWRTTDIKAGFNMETITCDKNDPTDHPRDIKFWFQNARWDGNWNQYNALPADSNGTSINIPNSNASFRVGAAPSRYANAKIGAVMIYHKTLTAQEIAQNFQAMRSDYGV